MIRCSQVRVLVGAFSTLEATDGRSRAEQDVLRKWAGTMGQEDGGEVNRVNLEIFSDYL
jgi:hypothetical protein